MKPKALMLSAAVLLGGTAVALAQSNSPPTITPSGATAQHTNESPSSPASTPKQAQMQPPRTSKHRVMAARHIAPRSTERDRATTALNLLESNGYRDFSTFRPAGRDYEITTNRNGKSMTVVVNPDTKTVRTQG